MRKILSLSAILLSILLLNSCHSNQLTVKGDKNVITKEIDITDYNNLRVGISSEVHYTQSDELPFLSIEMDKNLFDHLIVEADGNALNIRPEDRTRLKSSKCIIHTNSKVLQQMDLAGSVKAEIHSKLNTPSLEINGAGSINLVCKELETESSKIALAGRGTITLAGTCIKSKYEIAGSGNIYTAELLQDVVNCDIAGSGYMEANAKEELHCSIAGSGTIKYKGNPKINKSIAGFGSVKQMD